MTDVPNLTITKNGVTITIYIDGEGKYNFTKILNLIKAPTPTGQQGVVSGTMPVPVKLLDLLRIEERFTFNGRIDTTDVASFRNMIRAGGAVAIVWDAAAFSDVSGAFTVGIEKFEISKPANQEQDDRQITITMVVGSDL